MAASDRHLDDDHRATAEDLQEDAQKLADLERDKAQLDVADPRATELADQAERLTDAMARKADVEKELATRGRREG